MPEAVGNQEIAVQVCDKIEGLRSQRIEVPNHIHVEESGLRVAFVGVNE